MKRLTSDNVFEMSMTELALNQVFVRDGWAWYRKGPDDECSVCDLIRSVSAKGLWQENIDLDPNLTDMGMGDVMLDWLQFGEEEPEGVLAILYRALWAMAEVRERLKLYEDAMPLERAQDLAQAEKDGRLVVLPCKVGDTVWTNFAMSGWYFRDKDKPYSARVVFMGLNDSDATGRGLINVVYGKHDCMTQFSLSDIGKSVFLTREEAEAALKKREADNEAD